MENKEFFKFYQENPHLETFFKQFILYLYCNSDMSNEIIRDLINQLPNKIKDKAMSTYAQIKTEGKIEGKEEMIIDGWKSGLSIDMLSNISGFSVERV